MRIKSLIVSALAFCCVSPLAHAELDECKRVGYTNCTVNADCHAIVYARGGMCIKLKDIAQGKKYICEKSGVVAIDKVDYAEAVAQGLNVKQTTWERLEIDAQAAKESQNQIMFGIYDPYDMPERFTVTCKIQN